MKPNKSKNVLILIPETDFDPTEVAVPWKILTSVGHQMLFATHSGRQGSADPKIISGHGLGIFKSMLIADKNGRLAYTQLKDDESFENPLSYAELKPEDFDALILPGGHAPGMKPYLESSILQALWAIFI
jgi:protease I